MLKIVGHQHTWGALTDTAIGVRIARFAIMVNVVKAIDASGGSVPISACQGPTDTHAVLMVIYARGCKFLANLAMRMPMASAGLRRTPVRVNMELQPHACRPVPEPKW